MDLLQCSIVLVRVGKTRRPQQTQLLFNMTQLPVEISAITGSLLGTIWRSLWGSPHTFCQWKTILTGMYIFWHGSLQVWVSFLYFSVLGLHILPCKLTEPKERIIERSFLDASVKKSSDALFCCLIMSSTNDSRVLISHCWPGLRSKWGSGLFLAFDRDWAILFMS